MKVRRGWGIALLVMTLTAGMSVFGVPHDPKNNWPVPAEAKKMKNPAARTDASLAAAKAIFNDQCANCHGEGGKGDGPDAMMYTPEPADLTDAHMMGMMTDGEIFYKITEGRKPMPSFQKKFTDEQRWQLVHFVRTLASKHQHAPAAKKPAVRKPKTENRN